MKSKYVRDPSEFDNLVKGLAHILSKNPWLALNIKTIVRVDAGKKHGWQIYYEE